MCEQQSGADLGERGDSRPGEVAVLETPVKMATSGARRCPLSAIVIATIATTPCTMPPTMTKVGDADIPRSR